ncbi:MAG: ATP-dependent 6-phosphofructokinase [Spirochaetales bacterium]
MKKIAVLTSGGDAPGMNACLANLFELCKRFNYRLICFRQGYIGLIDNDFVILKEHDIENIYSLGGSIIKTGRSKEFLTKEGQLKAIETLKINDIDTLIVIGGNGSYRGAQDLEKLGVKVIAIPGTIDNDLNYSTRSLGFDTAVNNSVSAIDKIKDTMSANNRGVVIEVMGRNSGDIALYSAVASNANAIVVKEVPESKNEIIGSVERAIKRGVTSPTVVVAENILDSAKLAETLEAKTGITFKTTVLGYIQRGGNPTVFDRNFAMQLAVKSIELIEVGKHNIAIGMKNGKIHCENLDKVLTEKTNFNFELYDLFKKLNS